MCSSNYLFITVFFLCPSFGNSLFYQFNVFLSLCSECSTVVVENRASVVQNMFVRGFEQSGRTDLENTEDNG